MLLVDYSSAFNTVIPNKLTHKLSALGLNPTLCDWLLDFLTGRPQSVRMCNRTSASIITNVGTPQGYLGVHISEDLTWTVDTTQLVKKAQQRLNFLKEGSGSLACRLRFSGISTAALLRAT